MCDRLKVSKSGYYDWHGRAPSKRAAANVTLLAQIEAAHTKSDATYGMPRIRAELADQGVVASRKRIASIMRLAHIRGVSRRRGYMVTTTRDKRQRPAPDLVKRNQQTWKTHTEARLAIFTWIEAWYNPHRRHSSLGQISPINFERLNVQKKEGNYSAALM
jgi:putative transposase